MKKPSPYMQGIWDGTCCVYAFLNAIQYLRGELDEDVGYNLLYALVDHFGDYGKIVKEGIDAIPAQELFSLLSEKFPELADGISCAPPSWLDECGLDKGKIFAKIEADLNAADGDLIVYVGIEDYIEGGHWTLIRRVNHRLVYFFDSVGMRSRHLDNIVMTDEDIEKVTGQLTYIKPSEIVYFNRTAI